MSALKWSSVERLVKRLFYDATHNICFYVYFIGGLVYKK